MNKKLGESRTYKLCTQPKKEKSPVYLLTIEVKQMLKGQNMMDVDALSNIVQDLLRGNALTVFNNEQAMFKSQYLENLKHCLNAVTVQ
eukprot:1904440-Ditylum_brightwellii.AAC.1